jgi:hypothetical protein
MNDTTDDTTTTTATDDTGDIFQQYEPIVIKDIPKEVKVADEVEALARKRWILGAVMLVGIVASIGGFIWITQSASYDFPVMLVIIPLFIVFGILALVFNQLNEKIKKLVSDNITLAVLREAFPDVKYYYKGHIDRGIIESSRLIPGWEKCTGSDYVEAEYRGVNIRFSDIKLTHEVEDDDGKKTVTDFEGQWVMCRMAKTLPAQVWLTEKGRTLKLFGNSADVETENAEFNKKYQIRADDPHTAFYVLTPHFMEYIVQMDERAGGRTYMWFAGDYAHVAIHNKRNLFEDFDASIGGMLKPTSYDSLRGRFKQDIRYITGIVDELLQNDYLFGKTIQ